MHICRCEPVSCPFRDWSSGNTRVMSYGKRRRRRDTSIMVNKRSYDSSQTNGAKVLVTQAFVVTDKFKKKSRCEKVFH